MRRGELWLAEVGRKKRPVLVMTRTEVIDVRALVTVAEVTTSIRGLASEVRVLGTVLLKVCSPRRLMRLV